MTINLSAYGAVQTGLFVRIQVDEYRVNSGDSYTAQVLRFSDYNRTVVINGESYLGLGQLLSVGTTNSEIRASEGNLSLGISGIPNTSISAIVNSRIKGCPVQVWRVFFDAASGQQLAIAGNPLMRFKGIINNYSLEEEYDYQAQISSNTILFDCTSDVTILQNKMNGRKTNPTDMKNLYPSDTSFDRVLALQGSNFNFGSPK